MYIYLFIYIYKHDLFHFICLTWCYDKLDIHIDIPSSIFKLLKLLYLSLIILLYYHVDAFYNPNKKWEGKENNYRNNENNKNSKNENEK